MFDQERFDGLKDAEGFVTKEQVLAAAPPVPSAPAPEESPAPSAEEHHPLRRRVDVLWGSMPKDASGEVERDACWEAILADKELVGLIGDGDAEKGLSLLANMKEAKMLDVDHNGKIDSQEMLRLVATCVLDEALALMEDHGNGLSAAELRAKVEDMWAALPGKNAQGEVERLACWRQILVDEELLNMIGNGNLKTGKQTLLAMKAARGLDVNADGHISESEYHRLLTHHKNYAYHPEDHAPRLKHLSAAAGAAGLLKSLKTPDNLTTAQLILFKLAQKLGIEGDSKTSGFGQTHHPAHVNWFKCFKILDLDANRNLECKSSLPCAEVLIFSLLHAFTT